jgi:hypothetical protein
VFAAKGIFAPGDTGQTLINYQNLLNNLSANIKNQIASAVNRGIVNVTPTTNPTGFGDHLGLGVKTIAVTSGGSGYTAAPAVTIAPPPNGPNAAPATAVAVMTGDTVKGVIITSPGNGYDRLVAPSVTFSPPLKIGGSPCTPDHVTECPGAGESSAPRTSPPRGTRCSPGASFITTETSLLFCDRADRR